MVALAKIPVYMPVEEFLAWDPGDEHTWQLVDGAARSVAGDGRLRNGSARR